MRKVFGVSTLIGLVLLADVSLAADQKEFEYPELLVSPSASERLAAEAKTENKTRWTTHWAIQASALTTLMAGMTSNGDPGKAVAAGEEAGSKTAAKAATYVGGLWLAATTALSATYTPYQTGLAGMKGLANGTKKEKLAYERYAEEALYAPSRVATVMKWAAFASNAGASAMVVSNGTEGMTKLMGAIGVIGSFMPLAFEHEWNSVYRFQSDYKKRIYGPLASATMSVVPRDGSMAAVTTLAWEF